ncbi:GyrI-like domain-containing protein [Reichenbachiella sp. MALMAid0571]|uniref:GyrI-like domain-containing protein n=1 Tax=Reichenbachiella sp. MALMAid0571 TaxID=3143939 RepID=UPI0032E03053
MNLIPRIEFIKEKKLVGFNRQMSISNDTTFELWQNFMKRRNEIKNRSNPHFYSMQVYDEALDFKNFTPHTEFEKWAAAEVSDFDNIPATMKSYTLKGGKYAVFLYKGIASDFHKTAQQIYGVWLPNSEYEPDQREHFEILDENYDPNDPNSEEEIWIPVK